MQNGDLNNLDSEQLSKIKDKYQLMDKKEDEITEDHEQFNLNFNTYRKSRGRCKIELKIGIVYILELGKKEK